MDLDYDAMASSTGRLRRLVPERVAKGLYAIHRTDNTVAVYWWRLNGGGVVNKMYFANADTFPTDEDIALICLVAP